MNERVILPTAGPATLAILGALLAALIVGGIAFVIVRRIRINRAQRHRQSRAIENMLKEHGFDPNTAETIREFLRRNAPNDAVTALTTREGFENCVESEMNALIKTGDQKLIEKAGSVLRLVRSELGLEHVPTGQRIISTRELHHSQWVDLASADGATPTWSRCMIEDVDEAFMFVTFRGESDPRPPKFSAGDAVRCRLWRDEDARYFFRTVVAVDESPPPSWRLLHTHAMDRQQERAHYRLRHEQDVMIGVMPLPADGGVIPPGARPATRMRGRVTSLSAGGCALVVNQPVSKQVILRVPFEIPGRDTPLEADVSIITTTTISGGRVLVRGSFVSLDATTRDQIAKYVLRRQQRKIALENERALE